MQRPRAAASNSMRLILFCQSRSSSASVMPLSRRAANTDKSFRSIPSTGYSSCDSKRK